MAPQNSIIKEIIPRNTLKTETFDPHCPALLDIYPDWMLNETILNTHFLWAWVATQGESNGESSLQNLLCKL